MPDLNDLLTALDAGQTIPGGSPLHEVMHRISQDALRITGELNGGYHDQAQVRDLLAQLTGTSIADSVTVFPPLTSDFGRNLRIGQRVFINSGCRFQDQGRSEERRVGKECRCRWEEKHTEYKVAHKHMST